MTLCGEGTLVNTGADKARAVTLRCRSWNCDYCAPKRRDQVVAAVCGGKPKRLITLTIRPTQNVTPAADAAAMAVAWRKLIAALREIFPTADWQYFAVFEAHKSGRPHLHIAVRGCFVNVIWLRRAWQQFSGSPGVRIDYIKNPDRAAAYVAKYLGKDLHRFGTCKRYWSSQAWEVEPPEERPDLPGFGPIWEKRNQALSTVAYMWANMGWSLWMDDGTLYGAAAPPVGVELVDWRDVPS